MYLSKKVMSSNKKHKTKIPVNQCESLTLIDINRRIEELSAELNRLVELKYKIFDEAQAQMGNNRPSYFS